MKIEYTGRQTEISKDIQRLAERKLHKVAKALPRMTRAHVILTADKHRQIAEVSVHSRNLDLSAVGREHATRACRCRPRWTSSCARPSGSRPSAATARAPRPPAGRSPARPPRRRRPRSSRRRLEIPEGDPQPSPRGEADEPRRGDPRDREPGGRRARVPRCRLRSRPGALSAPGRAPGAHRARGLMAAGRSRAGERRASPRRSLRRGTRACRWRRCWTRRPPSSSSRASPGEAGLDHRVHLARVQRPGLALTGYTDYIRYGRVQIVGSSEIGYLRKLTPRGRASILARLCRCRDHLLRGHQGARAAARAGLGRADGGGPGAHDAPRVDEVHQAAVRRSSRSGWPPDCTSTPCSSTCSGWGP